MFPSHVLQHADGNEHVVVAGDIAVVVLHEFDHGGEAFLLCHLPGESNLLMGDVESLYLHAIVLGHIHGLCTPTTARFDQFLAVWFVIVLTPLLPFKNHFTEYYVIVPAIGLSILAAWAIASSRQALTLGVAAALAVGYFTLSIADDHMAEKYHYNNSRRMKYLIKGLESQQKLRLREVVLLSGIDNDLFWSGFCDNPFRLLGIYHTYVVPASANAIQPHPEWGCDTSRFFVNVDDAVPPLRNGHGSVFDLDRKSTRLN